jgi:hypothetical protein
MRGREWAGEFALVGGRANETRAKREREKNTSGGGS